jgi:hypothetical protein
LVGRDSSCFSRGLRYLARDLRSEPTSSGTGGVTNLEEHTYSPSSNHGRQRGGTAQRLRNQVPLRFQLSWFYCKCTNRDGKHMLRVKSTSGCKHRGPFKIPNVQATRFPCRTPCCSRPKRTVGRADKRKVLLWLFFVLGTDLLHETAEEARFVAAKQLNTVYRVERCRNSSDTWPLVLGACIIVCATMVPRTIAKVKNLPVPAAHLPYGDPAQ